AHQGVAILGMLGEHRDPDAQVDFDRLVVDAERFADRLQDLLGDQHRSRHIGRAPGQHRKLVAAVARYGIGLAKHGPHSLAHLLYNRSPASWPRLSLTLLNPSRSISNTAQGFISRS